jgi:HAD superfamily hydrolase (TIGR01509 family)
MALSLIMFDCDGVLIDSEIIAARVESERLTELGYEISAEEIAERFAGLTLVRMMELLREETGMNFPEDFVEKTDAEIERRLSSDVQAIAGAAEMLDKLDLPRCICSNSMGMRLEMCLRKVGLWDRFRPYVFSALEVGTKRGKPAPDVYLYGAEQFGAPPRETVVIEDSVHGVAAAAAAGCRVVGFVGGKHTYPGHGDALTEAGAETIIKRLSEFPAVVAAFAEWEAA